MVFTVSLLFQHGAEAFTVSSRPTSHSLQIYNSNNNENEAFGDSDKELLQHRLLEMRGGNLGYHSSFINNYLETWVYYVFKK